MSESRSEQEVSLLGINRTGDTLNKIIDTKDGKIETGGVYLPVIDDDPNADSILKRIISFTKDNTGIATVPRGGDIGLRKAVIQDVIDTVSKENITKSIEVIKDYFLKNKTNLLYESNSGEIGDGFF